MSIPTDRFLVRLPWRMRTEMIDDKGLAATLEFLADEPVNAAEFTGASGLKLVDIVSRRIRRPWWWPGRKEWAITFVFRFPSPEEPSA